MNESLFPLLVLAGRLLLAAVFAFAGIAKLRDRGGTWSMLRAFGLGIAASDALAPVLPWIEIATALALIPTASATAGAIAALVLLAVFSAAIAYNVAKGRRPECRCFGDVGVEPVGHKTIVRNAFFAVLGTAAIVDPSSHIDPIAIGLLRDYGLVAVVAAACAVVAVQTLLIWQILKQQGRMLQRIDALEAQPVQYDDGGATRPVSYLQPGQAAPSFELNDLDGAVVSLRALCAAGRPVVLFFVHPTCGPCRLLVPDIVRWRQELAQTHTTVVISQGTPAENREFVPGMPSHDILLQVEHEVGDAFHAYGTPAAVVIDPHGAIASELASGAEAIAALLGVEWSAGKSSNGRASAASLAVGAEAPAFSLRTADGAAFRSSELRGTDSALVFWNPTCGFCRSAADDLIRWGRIDGLRLVVLSSAPDAELTAGGFQGTLAIDDDMRVGAAFGAGGTPMAVLVDADGRVASALAAGRDAIEGLLRSRVPSVAP